MFEPKYIKTEDNQIVIFPAKYKHSEFAHMNPVSVGFIAIGAQGRLQPSISCYGKSVSLGLESDPKDTELATKQFINYHY